MSLTENGLLPHSNIPLLSWFDPYLKNIFVPYPKNIFVPYPFHHISASETTLPWPFTFKSVLSNLKSVLGRPLHFLWAAIWIPCTLPLPIFVPIVLWSLLTLLKCEIINFGDLRQKALCSWKFRIFYSAAFLRILRRNNFNCQITPRVNPD